MRLARCDGPKCGKVRPQHYEDSHGYYEWIHVDANEDSDHGDFCTWSCLAAWAVRRACEREGLSDAPSHTAETDAP